VGKSGNYFIEHLPDHRYAYLIAWRYYLMNTPLNFTAHAETMMHERNIQKDWVLRTVSSPDRTEERQADEKHYLKQIPEAGGDKPSGNHQSFNVSPSRDHDVL
jgi:predicted DNA binding protein